MVSPGPAFNLLQYSRASSRRRSKSKADLSTCLLPRPQEQGVRSCGGLGHQLPRFLIKSSSSSSLQAFQQGSISVSVGGGLFSASSTFAGSRLHPIPAHPSSPPQGSCASPAHARPSLRISVSGKIRVHWPFLLMLTVGLSVVKESLFGALRSSSKSLSVRWYRQRFSMTTHRHG